MPRIGGMQAFGVRHSGLTAILHITGPASQRKFCSYCCGVYGATPMLRNGQAVLRGPTYGRLAGTQGKFEQVHTPVQSRTGC